MLIDWFTVIAQVINFLILVWLLKRFLYKPVLRAIEEREKKIATQLQEAAAQKASAQEEEEKFEKMNQEFQQNKESLMTKAESDANERKNQLLTEARKEYADLRSGMQQSLQDEQEKLTEEIAKRTRSEVFAIVKKMWADLADADFDEKITTVFIQRLRGIKEEEKRLLQKSLASAKHPQIIIQSGFEISSDQKKALEDIVQQLVNIDCDVNFQTDPEQTKGIELRSNGYKLSWSAMDYFSSLETISTKGTSEINNSYAG